MIENTILSSLIHNEEYTRRTIPFLKEEYFNSHEDRIIFNTIYDYVEKYNGLPNKEALQISVNDRNDLNETLYKNISDQIEGLKFDLENDKLDWMIDETEKFCQEKAIYNAVHQSLLILDNKDQTQDKGGIPQLLSDALGVGFDTHIGHDFINDSEERFEFYHTREDKIPFDLEYMNKVTKGGVSRKSLSIALAGTGVGKTLFMTHCAASNLMDGLNVLYITMEMAEERIAERIDANLLDVTLEQLRLLDKKSYESRIDGVKSRTNGKLVIKEYPTASASSNHFRFLLNELKMKKKFVPDIIYIDYLNICSSARLKYGANVNSYTYIKTIAEELRGLAVEFNVPIFSATQTTRTGYSSSDLGLEDTSESFGLPATADFMIGLISSEELEELGQLMIKQLKNRWGDVSSPKRFVVGIDRSKMRLYNIEKDAQNVIGGPKDDEPIMDSSSFGSDPDFEMKNISKPNFKGFL